jgi:hypothetical protein
MRFRALGHLLLPLLLCAALGDSGPAVRATAHARTTRLYSSTLVRPRATRDINGHVVVSMEAQGDLRGLMTLELAPQGDGGEYAGTWALNVAYLQDLNADGTVAVVVPREEPDDHHDHDHHRERVRFVREGTIFGPVARATLHLVDDGSIDGLAFAQLVVAHGSLAFASAAGFGTVDRSPLTPPVTTLSLDF